MKRFHFPLRPVAVLRAHRESRAREALAAAIQAAILAEERASAAGVRVRELAIAICGRRSEPAGARDEMSFNQIYRRECTAETAAHKLWVAAREVVEQRREAYVEASRQAKMVSRLEERARAAHRLEGLRCEQIALDEIAGRRRLVGGLVS